MQFERSIFQDLESFLRTMRVDEEDINFILRNFVFSNIEIREKLAGLYEVSDFKTTLDGLIKTNVSTDNFTMK